MLIKLDTIIKNFKDENYKNDSVDLTVGLALMNILSTTVNSKNTAQLDPLKSYLLVNDIKQHIKDKKDLQLSASDIVYITTLVKESTYFPFIQGFLINHLDPKSK